MPGRAPRKKMLSRKAQEALSSPIAPPSSQPTTPAYEYPPPPGEEDDPFDLPLRSESQTETQASDSIEVSAASTQPESQPELPDDTPSDAPNATTPPPQVAKTSKDRLDWTVEMEQTLFEALLEQRRDGQKADNGWKTRAWEKAYDAVLAVAPEERKPTLTVGKMKTKELYFKGLYRDWKWLTAQSGWGIDARTGCVTASDQSWEGVIIVRIIQSL